MNETILVTGGTGKTGKRVAARLKALDVNVRIGSRRADPSFDWQDAATWPAALKDVQKVYVAFQPDLAVPGAVETIRVFVQEVKKAGIKKIVLLTGRGEEAALQCEEVVIESGIDYTIVRASWFNQNFSESFFLDAINAGLVALPAGHVKEPFINAEDIAEVVAAALTDPKHAFKTYEVSGPQLISFPDAIQEISRAIDKPVQYQEVSIEEYTAMLRSFNVPEGFIWLVQYLFTNVLDGRNEYIASGVEEALGRRPTSFQAFVKRTAASGVWNVTRHEEIGS